MGTRPTIDVDRHDLSVSRIGQIHNRQLVGFALLAGGYPHIQEGDVERTVAGHKCVPFVGRRDVEAEVSATDLSRRVAAALPIPLVPPVTIARRPLSSCSFSRATVRSGERPERGARQSIGSPASIEITGSASAWVDVISMDRVGPSTFEVMSRNEQHERSRSISSSAPAASEAGATRRTPP